MIPNIGSYDFFFWGEYSDNSTPYSVRPSQHAEIIPICPQYVANGYQRILMDRYTYVRASV